MTDQFFDDFDIARGVDLTRLDACTLPDLHVERCPKCRGSGRFVSYGGRDMGECFSCKGKGNRAFKNDAQTRAKARDDRAAAKQRRVQEGLDAWAAQHPADYAWLVAKQHKFEFAKSMLEALAKFETLTERQHETVTRLRLKDEQVQPATASIDVTKIDTALNKARAHILHPKLRLADFVFSLAGPISANAGAVYVKGTTGTYLGKVMQGKFTQSRDCTPDLQAAILAAAADPEAAATAYGQAYGRCSCCGRTLTNAESIARAIGPICAERFGW